MTKRTPPVDVMFRVDRKEGDVYALLPGLAGTREPHTCVCFSRDGHASADLTGCVRSSRPATPEQRAGLERTMLAYPYLYSLRPVARSTRRHERLRIGQTR